MASINIKDLKIYITEENLVGFGKEAHVYNYDNKLLKIFREDRKTLLPRIPDKGLEKMTTLPLEVFSKPLDLVYDNNKIVGYTKKNIPKGEELDVNNLNLEEIKEDVVLLGENGFMMEDIFYNYIYHDKKIHFTDISSFKYIEANNPFLKKHFHKKNIEMINVFLVGLIEFDAFRKGSKYELTKTFLANQFIRDNRIEEYYGDYLFNKKIK